MKEMKHNITYLMSAIELQKLQYISPYTLNFQVRFSTISYPAGENTDLTTFKKYRVFN